MTAQQKPMKPVKLSIDNPAEDVPRVISAAGKACGGDWGLCLLPRSARGMLVHIVDGQARVWRSTAEQDAPSRPTVTGNAAQDSKEVVAMPRSAPKPAAGRSSDVSLKGTWSGTVSCDEGGPDIKLHRKVAPYAEVELRNRDGAWRWLLRRTQTWFSLPSEHEGAQNTLAKAVLEVTQVLNGVLGEACALRDGRRRGALDATFAGKRPSDLAEPARMPRGARDVSAWEPRLSPKKPTRAGAGPTGDELMPAGEFTHWIHDDEFPETTHLKTPSAALIQAIKKLGLTYDAGAGSTLGITTEEWEGYPVGSLVFRHAEDGDGFYIARSQPAPRSTGGRVSASAKALAAQAKAAMAALASAPETAKPTDQQERTSAAHIEIVADSLAQVGVAPEEDLDGLGVSDTEFWGSLDMTHWRLLNEAIDVLMKGDAHRVQAGQAAAIWRDGTPPDGSPPLGWPDGRRDWATMPVGALKAEMLRFSTGLTDFPFAALVEKVYVGLLEVTPPFAASFGLVAYARKHLASPRCQDPERAEARQSLGRAINVLEGIATRRRAGEIPANQLVAMRSQAREITLAAAKLARACGKGQRSLGLGAAPAAAPAPAAGLPMPTTWAELQPWLVAEYRAAGVNHAKVVWMASELAGLLYRGEFGDLLDPNTNKVGADLVAKLMGVKPFKTAKAVKEYLIGVPAIKLTGRLPGTEERKAAPSEDDVRAGVDARYPELAYSTRARLRRSVVEAAAMLERSEEEQYIDTGDATELLNKARELLPEGDWLRGQIDLLNQQSEENEETDSDDVVTLLNELVKLGEAPPAKPALVREPPAPPERMTFAGLMERTANGQSVVVFQARKKLIVERQQFGTGGLVVFTTAPRYRWGDIEDDKAHLLGQLREYPLPALTGLPEDPWKGADFVPSKAQVKDFRILPILNALNLSPPADYILYYDKELKGWCTEFGRGVTVQGWTAEDLAVSLAFGPQWFARVAPVPEPGEVVVPISEKIEAGPKPAKGGLYIVESVTPSGQAMTVRHSATGEKLQGLVLGWRMARPDEAAAAKAANPEAPSLKDKGVFSVVADPPATRPTRANDDRPRTNDDKIAAALQAGVKNALADIFG